MARQKLVMGNWKLNGSMGLIDTLSGEWQSLAWDQQVQVAIAPPLMFTSYLKQKMGKNWKIGAQNCDIQQEGAYTGDISAKMLKEVGVEYVIVGHSERRAYHNESDELVATKFGSVQAQGLVPVLCIGEKEADNEAGLTLAVCTKQLQAVIEQHGIQAFKQAVIAYEPIWAIGTGKAATPAQAQAIHAGLRTYLAQQDVQVAQQVSILYGGSVTGDNAKDLFSQADIDGALVGGASLKADAFSKIIKALG